MVEKVYSKEGKEIRQRGILPQLFSKHNQTRTMQSSPIWIEELSSLPDYGYGPPLPPFVFIFPSTPSFCSPQNQLAPKDMIHIPIKTIPYVARDLLHHQNQYTYATPLKNNQQTH